MPEYKQLSILKAAHRASACSAAEVAAHAGRAAIEEQALRTATINRTAPIVANGTDIAEQTIAVAAVARHGQFKQWGKSPLGIITTPT